MMTGHWILDSDTPVPEPDVLKWAKWFSTADRVVARTKIKTRWRLDIVSTVFLGIDHSWTKWSSDTPLLWETMVFNCKGDSRYDIQERCGGTRNDALAMHRRVVAQVQRLQRHSAGGLSNV